MNSRVKFFILTMTVVVFGFLIFTFTQLTKNEIQITPEKTNNRPGPIVIKGAEEFEELSAEFSISPDPGGELKYIENYLIYWPKEGVGFTDGENYTVNIKGLKTKSNKIFDDFLIEFNVDSTKDYSKLQLEVLQKFDTLEGAETAVPVLSLLPYTEPFNFKINYYALENSDNPKWPEDYIFLIDTLVLQERNEDYSTYVNNVKQARQEAINWLTQQGVNTEELIIEFTPSDTELL